MNFYAIFRLIAFIASFSSGITLLARTRFDRKESMRDDSDAYLKSRWKYPHFVYKIDAVFGFFYGVGLLLAINLSDLSADARLPLVQITICLLLLGMYGMSIQYWGVFFHAMRIYEARKWFVPGALQREVLRLVAGVSLATSGHVLSFLGFALPA